MTHLWMTLTKGNKGPDGVEHNLQLLANLLCETAMFDLPYPDALGAERVRLFLESAVGDSSGISATAVGAAVGRTAEKRRPWDAPAFTAWAAADTAAAPNLGDTARSAYSAAGSSLLRSGA